MRITHVTVSSISWLPDRLLRQTLHHSPSLFGTHVMKFELCSESNWIRGYSVFPSTLPHFVHNDTSLCHCFIHFFAPWWTFITIPLPFLPLFSTHLVIFEFCYESNWIRRYSIFPIVGLLRRQCKNLTLNDFVLQLGINTLKFMQSSQYHQHPTGTQNL